MMKSKLNGWEFLTILAIWAGVVGVIYLLKDVIFGIIAVAAGYYLCKWIILKKDPDVELFKDEDDD